MNENLLIGKKVMIASSRETGTITSVKNGKITVDFYFYQNDYPFPAALATTLVLEDTEMQKCFAQEADDADFSQLKSDFKLSINQEINYLKETGGKKYYAVDGIRISSQSGHYVYSFDTDTEFHFPEDTPISIKWMDSYVKGYILGCEDFNITINITDYIGESIEYIEFTADQWLLLESLIERIDELEVDENTLAYELSCKGKYKVDKMKPIAKGQEAAKTHVANSSITVIWGPPGTGKTRTLAEIAIDFINAGMRVLMLSYSNVSVDGALLRVAQMIDNPKGKVVRYGYPRMTEVTDSMYLSTYKLALASNKGLADEYENLLERKKRIKNKSQEKIEINKRISEIRNEIKKYEHAIIQKSAFVATTVSKAIIDSSVNSQMFDVVIFDEASMAYVPQIIFSASLARKKFICLGDFRQLPAIVQNPYKTSKLRWDIFDFIKVTYAVENGYSHDWLVMLSMQYRMHKNIAEFASNIMYEKLLTTSSDIYDSRRRMAECIPNSGEAMSIVDLSESYSVCVKTMDQSRINVLSAMLSIYMASQIIDKYDVGIITPYSAQARLILAMVRDLREIDDKYRRITCATVHQFQGSEKPVIIYDAVDCFRMNYVGTLLTKQEENTADRLFNVALTRAQGKFILVGNMDFFRRKKISSKLMFSNAISAMKREGNLVNLDGLKSQYGNRVNNELMPYSIKESFDRFIDDINHSSRTITIDAPGAISEDKKLLDVLFDALEKAYIRGVDIRIRRESDSLLPNYLEKYVREANYVAVPISVIDKRIVWYGQPLCCADFISEGMPITTNIDYCQRFEGEITARILKTLIGF